MGFGLGFRVRVRVRIRVRVRVRRTPSVLNTEWMAAKEDIRLREAWRCPAAAEAAAGREPSTGRLTSGVERLRRATASSGCTPGGGRRATV